MLSTSTVKTNRKPRTVRAGIALAAVAAVAGTLGGFGTHTAQADQTDHFDTVNLMQGRDIGSVKDYVGVLNLQQTDLFGGGAFVSSCTGQKSFEVVTGDKSAQTIGSYWSSDDGEPSAYVSEEITQASTAQQATKDAQAVLTALRKCQSAPRGDTHYGPVYHGPLRNGDQVWLDIIDAKGRRTGGVGIMLQDRRVGVIQVTDAVLTTGNGDDAIKDLLYLAQPRLTA